MAKVNERMVVLRILEDMDTKNKFLNEVLDDYFFVYEFDKQQRSFISRLAYGSVENDLYLDYCINQVSKVKTNKMKKPLRYILRMALYQLLFMDKVPEHAIINEAVKLTVKRGYAQLKGFVNGVLRESVRKKDVFLEEVNKLSKTKYFSIRYSMAEDLVNYLLQQYSENELEAFLEASSKERKTCIRSNLLKTSTEELLNTLKGQIDVEEGHLLEQALYISGMDRIDKVPGFAEGLFTVQDESSMLVSVIADPKPGMKLLDVCAAPGGKSAYCAERMEDRGQIVSCDVSEGKLNKIRENIERLGISSIETQLQDATVYEESYQEAFDVVIADVPCSGLGILRSKPDIKKNLSLDKITSLVELQEKIIENVSRYVKQGGILLYSTCTINQEENRKQVKKFLALHKEFELLPLQEDPSLSESLKEALQSRFQEGMLQLITDEKLTDGFFIAKMRKKNDRY